MIVSAFIISAKTRTACLPVIGPHKAVFDMPEVLNMDSFDLEINFSHEINLFRTHDYRWVKPDSTCVSAAFAPKIIKIKDKYVQPSKPFGIWEIGDNNKQLRWRFNPEGANPLTVYGNGNSKTIVKSDIVHPGSIALLFANNAVELSRSPIPFSAIACFTDHCDFDTADSLTRQREFFKHSGIRVTKGFFLNHFSKRADNASLENQREEFDKWRADGHELAYHSLSQSIKSNAESFRDFENFTPPYPNLPTWIDHGYQPYNFSLYAHALDDNRYADTLQHKNISTLWNYTDSGTSTIGVINQLNPADFTLQKFASGNSSLAFKTRFSQLIKNIMFHFYADERIIDSYKNTAGSAKRVIYQKQLKSIWPMLKNFSKLSAPIVKVLLKWNQNRNKPYKFAKYSPVIFKHRISGRDFFVFQTIEMVDFVNSLAPENIQKLIDESGLFIAHTYFSVPASYHHGKMFQTPDRINPSVADNFNYLGSKIKSREIWNPTLAELVDFLANFEKTVLDTDSDGNIVVVESSGVPYRTIT